MYVYIHIIFMIPSLLNTSLPRWLQDDPCKNTRRAKQQTDCMCVYGITVQKEKSSVPKDIVTVV